MSDGFIINQKSARESFEELLARKRRYHILWIQGEAKMGKSRLLEGLRGAIVSRQHKTALVSLGHSTLSGDNLLDQFQQQLEHTNFPTYKTKIEQLATQKNIEIDGNQITNSNISVSGTPTKREELTQRQMLTTAFADDLSTLARKQRKPIVLFFDAFDQAQKETREWVVDLLLGRLCGKDKLLIVVASRDAPPDNSPWKYHCCIEQLTRYSQDDYREYCRVNNYQIRDVWIEAYHRGGKGNLGDFAEHAPTLHEGKI